MNNSTSPPIIIVSPLDWGLGHATRCIPIVRELIHQGAEVIIAGEGAGMKLLSIEFPDVRQVFLKGYNIWFSETISLGNHLLFSIPGIVLRIIKEHIQLRQLVRYTNAHAVISDNRYGLWSKNTYSVFITHQPNIIPPIGLKLFQPVLRSITRFFIRRYNECWIPDISDYPGMSGELSHGHKLPRNVKFIGLLSRFENERRGFQYQSLHNHEESYDIVAIISGPEPHRTAFENTLTGQLSGSSLKSLMVRGKIVRQDAPVKSGNLTIYNHLNASDLFAVLKNSKVVICRGGYSTLMDLAYTGNKVICIPTPGQTEQEYLARLADMHGYAVMSTQKEFRLKECYEKVMHSNSIVPDSGKVTFTVKQLLEILNSRVKG